MPDFVALAALIGLAMLVWDCFEVGRNDAANLVNAILGARVLQRRVAVTIAALAVVMGASFSSPVMETARKGIFDPSVLTIQMALAIYVSVYLVDTIMPDRSCSDHFIFFFLICSCHGNPPFYFIEKIV